MDPNGKFFKKVTSKQKLLANEESDSSEADKEDRCIHCQKYFIHCSTCYEGSFKDGGKRNSQSLLSLISTQKKVNSSVAIYKEQLERKILNEEINEQLSYDKHNTSKKQIQDLCTLIRGFSAYLHSLDVRCKASDTLQKKCCHINPDYHCILNRKDSSPVTLPKRIKEILQLCYTNIELPANYYEGCKEYSKQYKEHSEATLNFYYFLKEDKLSNTQMSSYDAEYDKVREKFNESKSAISSQMSTLISQRSDVIQRCVQGILPVLKEIMNQDKDIYNILQSLSSDVLNGNTHKLVSPRSLLSKSSKCLF